MAKDKPIGNGKGSKTDALAEAMAQVEKQFGAGALMRLGDRPRQKIEVIPSGSLSLDIALGVGGIPRGRIIELFGGESSGKTTLALHMLCEAQRAGGVGAIIDAEHAMDPQYAAKLGLNTDELLISQPETGEQALEIADVLVRSSAVDLVVIDSVAALTPKAEIEGEMGDQFVGLQARMMSQALRKLAGNLNRSNTAMIFINQIREKIGVMFGSPETTPGGRALKFYASVRIKTRRVQQIKEGGDAIGNEHVAQVVKNKVAPPFREANFEIIYGLGVSHAGELIQLGVDMGLIKKSGAWFSCGEERIGNGREAARRYLQENPALALRIENQIRTGQGLEALPVPPELADGAATAPAAPAAGA
ncbi:MAG: recombinase RecA [Armatimonadetes bacterium]|nr:recombinase RecA [Armatimonadota bacterium]